MHALRKTTHTSPLPLDDNGVCSDPHCGHPRCVTAYQLEFRALREGWDVATSSGDKDRVRWFWTFDDGSVLEYTPLVHYHASCEGYVPRTYFDGLVDTAENRESIKDYLETAAARRRGVLIQHAADVAGVE